MRKWFRKVNNNHSIIDAYRLGGRSGWWGIHYYAFRYTDFIFSIVSMVVIDIGFFFVCLFVFGEKIDVPGSV